ncbi:MAG: hypothetical protein IJS15_09510 [Victivallales bacterium]|nr:hypothetical protein [Victivallales bacterium]
MARPIESTPVLTGRSAIRFERLVNSCKYRPLHKRRVNWKKIDKILEEELAMKTDSSVQNEANGGC